MFLAPLHPLGYPSKELLGVDELSGKDQEPPEATATQMDPWAGQDVKNINPSP